MTTVEPADKDDVVRVALPFVSWTVPRTAFPAVNETGPVGLTVDDVILAVNVTAWPAVDGFCDDVRVAVVVAWLTT